jgi:hypothetical protein
VTAAEIVETLAMPLSTVSAILAARGLGRGRVGGRLPARSRPRRPDAVVLTDNGSAYIRKSPQSAREEAVRTIDACSADFLLGTAGAVGVSSLLCRYRRSGQRGRGGEV